MNIELQDAKKVDKAIEARMRHNRSLARRLLEEVIANTPQDYVYSYKEGDRLLVKFWNGDEFLQYATGFSDQQTEHEQLLWIANAYPRAHYQLACIDVEERNYESALAHLKASLELEPDQPLCFCEIAIVHVAMGRHERAVDFYDKALQARSHITATVRAMALRGKGAQLIELGSLDLAEECLKESLQYDPSSRLAMNELRCIAHLRSGKAPSLPAGLVTTEQSQHHVCEICGKKFIPQVGKQYVVGNVRGRVIYMCAECNKRSSKRWWQFWK